MATANPDDLSPPLLHATVANPARRGLWGQLLGPFVAVGAYVRALALGAVAALAPGARAADHGYGGEAHLLAFGVFSAFCLVGSSSATIDQGLLILCLLGGLGGYLAQPLPPNPGTWRSWVRLRTDAEGLIHESYFPDHGRFETRCPRHQADHLVLFPRELDGGGFEAAPPWRLALVTTAGDQLLLGDSVDLDRTVARARQLAAALELPVRVADSVGAGPWVEMPLPDTSNLPTTPSHGPPWVAHPTADGYRLARRAATTPWGPLGRRVFDVAGPYGLLLLGSGPMDDYGQLLHWLVGPPLGLSPPANLLEADWRFTATLGRLLPPLTPYSATAAAVVVAMAIREVRRAWLPRQLVFGDGQLRYSVSGRPPRRLATGAIAQLWLLASPRPQVVISGEDGNTLVVDELLDAAEGEALLGILMAQSGLKPQISPVNAPLLADP